MYLRLMISSMVNIIFTLIYRFSPIMSGLIAHLVTHVALVLV